MSVYETPESRWKRDNSYHHRPIAELTPVQLECRRAARRAQDLRKQKRKQGEAFQRQSELDAAENRWEELRKLHAEELNLRPSAQPRLNDDGTKRQPTEEKLPPLDGELVLASWKAWCGQVV